MNLPRILLIAGTLLAAPFLSSFRLGASELPRVLPPDTAIALHLRSAADMRENWSRTPMARTWAEADVRRFLGPIWQGMMGDPEGGEPADLARAFFEDTEMSGEEIVALFPGEVVIAIADFRPEFFGEGKGPHLIMAAQIGSERDKVHELLDSADKTDSVHEEEFQGETIFVTMSEGTDDEPPVEEACWVFIDDLVIMAQPKELLQRVIAQVRQRGESLADTPAYAAMVREQAGADITFFVNLAAIIPGAVESLKARQIAAMQAGKPMGGPLGMMGADMLFRALGLDALTAFYIAGQVDRDVTTIDMAIRWTDSRGLVKVLANVYGDPPSPRPDFVPDTWFYVTTGRSSPKRFYDTLREVVRETFPAADGQIQQSISGLNEHLGIDLERDLIGSFGDEIVGAYLENTLADGTINVTQPTSQFFAISLNDAASCSRVVSSLLGMLPPQVSQAINTREYLGETVHTLTPPVPNVPVVSLAVTRGYLMIVVGSPAMIETAIQNQAGARNPIWARRDLVRDLDRLPPGASSFVLCDMRRAASIMLDVLAQRMPREEGAEPPPRPDLELVSKHWSTLVSGVYMERGGARSHIRLQHVE